MWDFDTCTLCKGSGKVESGKCPVCKGMGLWEFVVEDNHLAVHALLTGETPESEWVKTLCNRRMAQVTPDNIEDVLRLLEASVQNTDFDALHASGAKKWGWAWVHANRFAIELCRLCGGDSTKHALALSRLAWKWLTEENQKKVDAPIDKPK
jgi:hypothetical protein